jgi:hypothetical protein
MAVQSRRAATEEAPEWGKQSSPFNALTAVRGETARILGSVVKGRIIASLLPFVLLLSERRSRVSRRSSSTIRCSLPKNELELTIDDRLSKDS